MHKVTILYGHPANPDAFEAYYLKTHLPISAKMEGISRVELTKFLASSEGGRPAYYRMAEMYFSDPAGMEKTLGSPEGQAAAGDIPNFATGGITIIIGTVEP